MTIYSVFFLRKWWLPIAMLNYQNVTLGGSLNIFLYILDFPSTREVVTDVITPLTKYIIHEIGMCGFLLRKSHTLMHMVRWCKISDQSCKKIMIGSSQMFEGPECYDLENTDASYEGIHWDKASWLEMFSTVKKQKDCMAPKWRFKECVLPQR